MVCEIVKYGEVLVCEIFVYFNVVWLVVLIVVVMEVSFEVVVVEFGLMILGWCKVNGFLGKVLIY